MGWLLISLGGVGAYFGGMVFARGRTMRGNFCGPCIFSGSLGLTLLDAIILR
jgi:hypothetical protein